MCASVGVFEGVLVPVSKRARGCARVNVYVCLTMLAGAELLPTAVVMEVVYLYVSPVSGQP